MYNNKYAILILVLINIMVCKLRVSTSVLDRLFHYTSLVATLCSYPD